MHKIAVIGGGAAGFFGAIECAKLLPYSQVTIYEKLQQCLSKVKISGGGRCNVTHNCFDPSHLTTFYPRGNLELRGPFSKFQPKDTIEWFEEKGIRLKTEADGRMFPVTDSSQTIIDCFFNEISKYPIDLQKQMEVISISKDGHKYRIDFVNGKIDFFDRILVATGSNPKMYSLLQKMGHTVIEPVPSLFTFTIQDSLLEEMQGCSFPLAKVKIEDKDYEQKGPLLITHWGLSGPAILKLSAWAARALHECKYNFFIHVNWMGDISKEEFRKKLGEARRLGGNKPVTLSPFPLIPKRFAKKLLEKAGIPEDRVYSHLSSTEISQLESILFDTRLLVNGKSLNKDEFVTCGGVKLSEVNFKTMESKLCPGIYFAGEVLDIDGITGGFNFQNAWSTSTIAARGIASSFS